LAAASTSPSLSSRSSPKKNTRPANGIEVIEGVEEDDVFSSLTPEEFTSVSGGLNFSLARPQRLAPTHGHLACKLVLSCVTQDLASLSFYTQFCMHAAYAFGLAASNPGTIPVKTSLRTVPRSPFVHKPSQENFVKKTHSRYIKIYDGKPETVDAFLTYLTENGMAGVSMKSNNYERVPVGFGKELVGENLSVDEEATTEAKVKALAEQLVKNGLGGSSEGGPDPSTAPGPEAAKEQSA